jgi:hypothetical protein
MRGEVSIFRGGAGGLSYFSSGSVRDGLRVGSSPAPEAAASATSKIKKVKMLVFDAVTKLEVNNARLRLILIVMGYEYLVQASAANVLLTAFEHGRGCVR